MKKFSALVLVLALVCTSVFAGAFTGSVRFGYDELNYAFNTKNVKIDFNIYNEKNKPVVPNGISESPIKMITNILTGWAFDDVMEKKTVKFYGPSVTLDTETKVGKNFAITAGATYVFPTSVKETGVNLFGGTQVPGGLINGILQIVNEGAESELADILPYLSFIEEVPINPNNAHINGISITSGRGQINKYLNGWEDLLNVALDAGFLAGVDANLKLDYNMHAMKANVGTEYSYAFKNAPVELAVRAGVGFTETFTQFKIKLTTKPAKDTTFVTLTEGILEYKLNEKNKAAILFNSNYMSFGLNAGADVKYNCSDKIAVALGVNCDFGVFNINKFTFKAKVKSPAIDNLIREENKKYLDWSIKNTVSSFAFAPSVSARAAFLIKF